MDAPPIIVVTPGGVPALSPKKTWRGGLLDCFGDCSAIDFGSCCMVTWVPFIAFGQNMRKAFSLSFIQQMLLVLVCLYGVQFTTELAGAVNCGQPPVAVGPMSGLASSDVSATDVAAVQQYNDCMAKWNFLYMLNIPVGLAFLVYGGWRRHQMRKRFNIPGSEWEDYGVWICCFPCALCQETRTLAANDVEDGSWPMGRGNGTGERQPLIFGQPSLIGGQPLKSYM